MGCGGMSIFKEPILPENKKSSIYSSDLQGFEQSRPLVSCENTRKGEARGFMSYGELPKAIDEENFTNFNLLFWSNDPETKARLMSGYNLPKVLSDGRKVKLSFFTEHSRPSVCDCALYFITRIDQLDEARKFRARYRDIWTHFLVSSLPEIGELQEELNAENVIEDYIAERLMGSYTSMIELVKNIYASINANHSGRVSVAEMKLALLRLDSNFSSEDVEDLVITMDIDKDEYVDFDEFVSWWRSGRNAPLMLQLSNSLGSQAPIAMKTLKSMTNSKLFTKKMNTKELIIAIGKPSARPTLTWLLKLGTAGWREKLLFSTLEVFGWLSKPHCLVLSFKTIENFDEAHLSYLISTCMALAMTSLRERTLIHKDIDYLLQMQGNTLFIGLPLDLSSKILKPLLKLLKEWQPILDAPVNQFFSLLLKSDSLADLSNSSLKIDMNHWSKAPRYLMRSVWKFVSCLGLDYLEPLLSQPKDLKTALNFENNDELNLSWIEENFQVITNHLSALLAMFPTIKPLYSELTMHTTPDFDVYMRFENLGVHSSVAMSEWPSFLGDLSSLRIVLN